MRDTGIVCKLSLLSFNFMDHKDAKICTVQIIKQVRNVLNPNLSVICLAAMEELHFPSSHFYTVAQIWLQLIGFEA